MAERTIVSCDWCGREVGEGELVRTRVRTGKRGRPRELELCPTCASAAGENAQLLPPAASPRPRRVVSTGRDGGAEAYEHKEEAVLRPEVGTQPQFRKRKPPKTYRYDSSLSPALDWDGQNSTRELGEWLLAQIEEASQLDPPHRFSEPRQFGDVEVGGLADAVERLKALSRPFLDWAGKAERLSFDVPTLPLFVHERLSTK